MSVRKLISSFNGGELSARLEGRTDADGIYDRGLAEMFNFVPTVEGPAVKRPGFRYIVPAPDEAEWLSTFVFNVTQAYVLLWLDEALRFFTNGGQIMAGASPYELTVPYAAAAAPRLSLSQSYDRIRIAHAGHPVGLLTRTAAEAFSYAPLVLKNGPFKDQNSDKAITVTLSGTFTVGGTATATASSAIFLAGHVGASFLVECKDFSDIPAWDVGIDGVVADSSKRRSDGKVYLAKTSGRTGSVQPTHSAGIEYDGSATGTDVNTKGPYGVKWEYLYDRFGIGTITAIGGAGTTATLTVTRRFPDSLATAASHKWAHAAFSAAEGYPHLATLWAGRMWYFKGLDFYVSVAGDYDNFARFTDGGLFAPDMGFHRTLDSTDPPLWVKADKQLLVGTASAEVLIGQINSAALISGDNIQAVPQSSYGSAEAWPLDIGSGAVIWIQPGRRKLREAQYEFERDRYVGINITVYARHIGRSGIRQLAFQQEPEEMLWGVRADGRLLAHAHSPEQQVKGFARVELAGGALARSVAAIPSEDGTKDELWLLGELDGAKAILLMADWWEEDLEASAAERMAQLKASFFVDFGVSYSGVAKAVFDEGLEHLEGLEVSILANGGVVRGLTVEDGALLLPYDATPVHIGLGYQARLRPMRPETRAAGTSQGLRKRISRLIARLIDTAALLVRDDKGHDERLIDRPGSAQMDQPVPLFSGDTANKAVGGGWDRNGQPLLISDDPLPCIVSALIFQLDVEDTR